MRGPALRPRRSTRHCAATLISGAPAFAVLAAAAVLFGCSDDPGGGASTATAATTVGDPCSLLTVEQIQTATGWEPSAGARPDGGSGGDPTVCNWEDVRVGGAIQVQVEAGAGELGFERDRAAVVAEGLATTEGGATVGGSVPNDLVIDGATAAFEVADLGRLTMLIGNDVVQLTVLGADLDGNERRQLATDVTAATTAPS